MIDYGKATDAVYDRSVNRLMHKRANSDQVVRDRWHADFLDEGQKLSVASVMSEAEDRQMGAMTVYQAVNRLGVSGSRANKMTAQIMMPAGETEADLKAISTSMTEACAHLALTPGQCDAMAVKGLKAPVATVTVMGRSASLFHPEPAKAGQDLIMAGFAGWRGSVRLAEKHHNQLAERFNPLFLSSVLEAEAESILMLKAIETAAAKGVHTMFAVGDGGIFAGIWAMAEREDKGVKIRLKDILLRQETVEISDYLGINPYQLLSDGTLLLAADHGQEVLTALSGAGIPAAIIGHLTDDHDRVVLNDDETRFLEPFRKDSVYEVEEK